jgi:hypothetical protein
VLCVKINTVREAIDIILIVLKPQSADIYWDILHENLSIEIQNLFISIVIYLMFHFVYDT